MPLVARLNGRGWSAELCDWSVPYAIDHFGGLSGDDCIVTLPYGGSKPLTESYRVPHERIIVVAHAEWDLITMIQHGGAAEFDEFAGYGVVSDSLVCSSLALGIRRIPTVLRPGIDTERFRCELLTALVDVGYAGVMHRQTVHGVEQKRGDLAEAAATGAGLGFRPAEGRSHLEMNDYDRDVQALLMPSLQE